VSGYDYASAVALAVGLSAGWLALYIVLNWHPGEKHCRCCPNWRPPTKKGGTP
jgi:hypothetical protein